MPARWRDLGAVGGDGSGAATFCFFVRLVDDDLMVSGDSSGLDSRCVAALRFLDLGAGRAGVGVGVGAAVGFAAVLSAASLAEERVILKDMRIWFCIQWRQRYDVEQKCGWCVHGSEVAAARRAQKRAQTGQVTSKRGSNYLCVEFDVEGVLWSEVSSVLEGAGAMRLNRHKRST